MNVITTEEITKQRESLTNTRVYKYFFICPNGFSCIACRSFTWSYGTFINYTSEIDGKPKTEARLTDTCLNKIRKHMGSAHYDKLTQCYAIYGSERMDEFNQLGDLQLSDNLLSTLDIRNILKGDSKTIEVVDMVDMSKPEYTESFGKSDSSTFTFTNSMSPTDTSRLIQSLSTNNNSRYTQLNEDTAIEIAIMESLKTLSEEENKRLIDRSKKDTMKLSNNNTSTMENGSDDGNGNGNGNEDEMQKIQKYYADMTQGHSKQKKYELELNPNDDNFLDIVDNLAYDADSDSDDESENPTSSTDTTSSYESNKSGKEEVD